MKIPFADGFAITGAGKHLVKRTGVGFFVDAILSEMRAVEKSPAAGSERGKIRAVVVLQQRLNLSKISVVKDRVPEIQPEGLFRVDGDGIRRKGAAGVVPAKDLKGAIRLLKLGNIFCDHRVLHVHHRPGRLHRQHWSRNEQSQKTEHTHQLFHDCIPSVYF